MHHNAICVMPQGSVFKIVLSSPLLSTLILLVIASSPMVLKIICVLLLMALIILISSLGLSPAYHIYSTFPFGCPTGISKLNMANTELTIFPQSCCPH